MTDSAEIRRGSETVLVVEDDEGVQALVRRALQRLGYEVLVADGPDQALRTVHEHEGRIDLLVSDVVLPLMSGPALAAEIRELRPGVRVLLMSGYTSEIVGASHGVEIDDTTFLKKPFSIATLGDAVRDALDTRIDDRPRVHAAV